MSVKVYRVHLHDDHHIGPPYMSWPVKDFHDLHISLSICHLHFYAAPLIPVKH